MLKVEKARSLKTNAAHDAKALKGEIRRRLQAEEQLAGQVNLVERLTLSAEKGRQAAILEERTCLAQEIHDTLAQGFAGIILQLEAAEAALANSWKEPQQKEKVLMRLGRAGELARESLAEARLSVASLRSTAAQTPALSEALARFLTQIALDTGVKSRYVLEGVPFALAIETEHNLLRIGQEAIANAMAHAQAREIEVELTFRTAQVRLRVRDDGQGFDARRPAPGRFGLVGMGERAGKIAGQLAIASRPGEGTEIGLIVPIPQNPNA